MNTNDFSKVKVGDKLRSIQLEECEVCRVSSSNQLAYPIAVIEIDGRCCVYTKDGKNTAMDKHQSLFFSNPNVIAPPEPPRLPDYKPGQLIAVWEKGFSPCIRSFIGFDAQGQCETRGNSYETVSWINHCALEELPKVLAKWEEKK